MKGRIVVPGMARWRVREGQAIAVTAGATETGRSAGTDDVIRVLERAARDREFIVQLTEHGSTALAGYNLSSEARAALLSGDIRWVERHVGKLNDRQKAWLLCRLEQERW